jgi:rubrerythrin
MTLRDSDALALPVPQDRLSDLRGTVTLENIKAAFAADAQSVRLLLYFARLAEIESFGDTALLLRSLAEAQALMADGSIDLLRRAGHPQTGKPIGETPQNIAATVEAARFEADSLLPKMAQTAHAEGFPDIASWFETLALAKADQAERCRAALEQLRDPE